MSASLALGSCGGGSSSSESPTEPTGTSLPNAATAADLAFCVQETNRYRSMVGVGGLQQAAAIEAYAATGAQVDGTAHAAHSHFNSTNGGGLTTAENEIPWWPLASFRTVQEVMRQGLAQMWAEGPSGGHYQHIAGPFSQMGCGVFINNGEITVVQNFR